MGVRVKEKRAFLKRKRDNYARKLRRKKLINYLRSQLRTCTTHGLPHIVNTEIHWFERLFWTASFLFSLGLIYNLISTQYTRFKSTPIVSIVEMDYFNWNVSYPAITLCPINNFDNDTIYIAASEKLELSGENIEAHLRAICTLSMDTMDTIDFDSLNVSSSLHPEDHAALATLLFRKFDNNSLTTSTNWPISIETAMTEVGLCHVINSNVANFDNPTKWGIATYEKKNVDLSVNEKDFFVQIVNYADMYKVFIHSPDEIILSTSATYTSRKNTFTQFGVQVWSTRISNVLRSTPISIRKCRFNDEPISERYPVYSYNHCLLECRIKMILNICDCIPHFYKPLDNERICNLTELQCFIDYKEAFIKLSISNGITNNFSYPAGIPQSPRDCECLNSCESDVYSKDHETFSPETETNRMRISISTYPKVRVVKDAIINTFDIILRSGGVINLCIGASIISLMELVMLAFKLLFHLLWLLLKSSFKRITVYPTCMNRITEIIIKKQH